MGMQVESGPVPNTTSRPVLRRWLVTGVCGTGLVVCALATAVYVGAAFGVVTGLLAALAALLPLGIVVPTFLWLDRFEAEPTKYLVVAFAWGALVASLLAMVANTGALALFQAAADEESAFAATGVLVAPVTEETLKGLFVLLVWRLRRREFDGVVDGLVYAGIVAAGFAFTENITYLAMAMTEGGPAAFGGVLVARGVFSPFAHPMFTCLTGLGIALASTARGSAGRWLFPVLGWVVAMIAHGAWNLLAFSGPSSLLVGYVLVGVPVFVAYSVFVVWMRRREGRLIAEHLRGYADAGWFSHGELAMLASMSGRRQAQAWARTTGGPRRLAAMRAFQDNASELGLLRSRMAAGRADANAPYLERSLLDTMYAARSALFAPVVPTHR